MANVKIEINVRKCVNVWLQWNGSSTNVAFATTGQGGRQEAVWAGRRAGQAIFSPGLNLPFSLALSHLPCAHTHSCDGWELRTVEDSPGSLLWEGSAAKHGKTPSATARIFLCRALRWLHACRRTTHTGRQASLRLPPTTAAFLLYTASASAYLPVPYIP